MSALLPRSCIQQAWRCVVGDGTSAAPLRRTIYRCGVQVRGVAGAVVDVSEGDVNLSRHRAGFSASHLDQSTRDFLEEDSRYFLHQTLSTPCLNAVRSCEGSSLYDLQGREILDFHGNSIHQLGYGHPKVISAITRQLQEMPFCPRRYTNAPAVKLARMLTERAPGDLSRVLFAPGGTSAVGMAIKLARAVTGRHKMVSMWESFHGASLDCVSIGGEATFRKNIGPLMPGVEHVPPPNPSNCLWDCGKRCSLRCADYIDYVLEQEGDVAAVIAEPVRAIPYFPEPEYWQKVRRACDRRGTLLIFDEIPMSLGRTGKLFTAEHFGVTPDILVLGKGLGGGVLPLAAMIAREPFNEPASHMALGHYTHEKNPVLCAAGVATLEALEEEQLPERAARLGAMAKSRLQAFQQRCSAVSDVRGLGLLMGVELVTADGAKALDLAERVLYRCLRDGLSFKVSAGNVLTLAPPLVISEEDLGRALDILERAIIEESQSA